MALCLGTGFGLPSPWSPQDPVCLSCHGEWEERIWAKPRSLAAVCLVCGMMITPISVLKANVCDISGTSHQLDTTEQTQTPGHDERARHPVVTELHSYGSSRTECPHFHAHAVPDMQPRFLVVISKTQTLHTSWVPLPQRTCAHLDCPYRRPSFLYFS